MFARPPIFLRNEGTLARKIQKNDRGWIASQRSNAKSYVRSGLSEPWSLNQFKSFRARSSYENDAEHVPANRISRRQNLCVTVTSLPTHTQRKKLKFSETALSFAVKVKLSPFACTFFVKLWRELRMRRAFDRCEVNSKYYPEFE